MKWRLLGLFGWLIVLVLGIYHAEQLPPKLTLLGINVTHDVSVTIVHQFGWMLVGLALAGLGMMRNAHSYIATIISASLYFVWRYAAGALRHGLITDLRMKWGAAAYYHFEPTFLVEDVLLPIAFFVIIAVTVRDSFFRRRLPGGNP